MKKSVEFPVTELHHSIGSLGGEERTKEKRNRKGKRSVDKRSHLSGLNRCGQAKMTEKVFPTTGARDGKKKKYHI